MLVPPITTFYGMFGSLEVGAHVTARLFFGDTLIGVTFTARSHHNARAQGHGFVSAVPIDRIEFTSNDPTAAVVGAFRFLLAGEPGLGTVHIPGYAGPRGDDVQLDFACVFAARSR